MQNGLYLDSCVLLGANSCYSASEHDQVYLEGLDEGSENSDGEGSNRRPAQGVGVDRSTGFVIELQVRILIPVFFLSSSLDEDEFLCN